jgi:hypothetical protein
MPLAWSTRTGDRTTEHGAEARESSQWAFAAQRNRHRPGARPARRGGDQPLHRRSFVRSFLCQRSLSPDDGGVPVVSGP